MVKWSQKREFSAWQMGSGIFSLSFRVTEFTQTVLETALKEVLSPTVAHSHFSFSSFVFKCFLAVTQQSAVFKTRRHTQGKGAT